MGKATGLGLWGLNILAAILVVGFGASSCRRPEEPKQSRPLAPDPPLSAPWDPRDFHQTKRASVELLNKMRRPDWLQERNDRRELVLPAPPGFQPEPVDRKLKLTLRLSTNRVRRGQKVFYRVELQNIGRKPVLFNEHESFLKDNRSITEGGFRFILTGPDGSTQTLRFTPRLISGNEVEVRLPGQGRWTVEESSAIVANLNDYTRRVRGLVVNLLPGETVYSRTRRDVDWVEEFFRTRGGEVPPAPAPVELRLLRTNFRFDTPGEFKLKAVLDLSGPGMPDEEHIADMVRRGYKRQELLANYRRWQDSAIGIVESDGVAFAVIP